MPTPHTHKKKQKKNHRTHTMQELLTKEHCNDFAKACLMHYIQNIKDADPPLEVNPGLLKFFSVCLLGEVDLRIEAGQIYLFKGERLARLDEMPEALKPLVASAERCSELFAKVRFNPSASEDKGVPMPGIDLLGAFKGNHILTQQLDRKDLLCACYQELRETSPPYLQSPLTAALWAFPEFLMDNGHLPGSRNLQIAAALIRSHLPLV